MFSHVSNTNNYLAIYSAEAEDEGKRFTLSDIIEDDEGIQTIILAEEALGKCCLRGNGFSAHLVVSFISEKRMALGKFGKTPLDQKPEKIDGLWYIKLPKVRRRLMGEPQLESQS